MSELSGYRILNPRPRAQAKRLTTALSALGATVLEVPLLEIAPTHHWRTQKLCLTLFHYAIFTSPNAVTYFFEHIPANTWPATLPIFAIGQGTSEQLLAYGLKARYTPNAPNSESMLSLPELNKVTQAKILLVKGVGGRQLLARTLRARQAEVHTCIVYRRQCPQAATPMLQALWRENAIDMIIITSATMLKHLFQCAETKDFRDWLRNKPFFVISERIASTFKHEKIKTMIVTNYENLLNTLKDFAHERYERKNT